MTLSSFGTTGMLTIYDPLKIDKDPDLKLLTGAVSVEFHVSRESMLPVVLV